MKLVLSHNKLNLQYLCGLNYNTFVTTIPLLVQLSTIYLCHNTFIHNTLYRYTTMDSIMVPKILRIGRTWESLSPSQLSPHVWASFTALIASPLALPVALIVGINSTGFDPVGDIGDCGRFLRQRRRACREHRWRSAGSTRVSGWPSREHYLSSKVGRTACSVRDALAGNPLIVSISPP